MKPYFLPPGYQAREAPEPFLDAPGNITWQPDVYTHALAVARQLQVNRVVDFGCGAAGKLGPLVAEFPTFGFDCVPANLANARQAHPAALFAFLDLDALPGLSNAYIAPSDALVIAADVIEHLRCPEQLLARCRFARAIILSTPDRDRTHKRPDHLGPPPNASHTREWTASEFAALLNHHLPGFDTVIEFTRSNDQDPALNTILATCQRRAA